MDTKGVLAYEDKARRGTLKKKRKSINFTVLSKSLLLYYLFFFGRIISFLFLIHIQFTSHEIKYFKVYKLTSL